MLQARAKHERERNEENWRQCRFVRENWETKRIKDNARERERKDLKVGDREIWRAKKTKAKSCFSVSNGFSLMIRHFQERDLGVLLYLSPLTTCPPSLHASHTATLHGSLCLSNTPLSLSKTLVFLQTHSLPLLSPLSPVWSQMTDLGFDRCGNCKSFASRFIGWKCGAGARRSRSGEKGNFVKRWGDCGDRGRYNDMDERKWSTRTERKRTSDQLILIFSEI